MKLVKLFLQGNNNVDSFNLFSYLKKSIGTGFINVAGSALISIIFIPLIINHIGLDLYGKWVLIFIFSGLAGILDLGISKSIVFLLPKRSDFSKKSEMFSAALIFSVAITFVVVALGIFLVFVLQKDIWFSEYSLAFDEGRKIFLVGLLLMCLSLLTNLFRSVLESFYHISVVNVGFLLLTVCNYTSVYLLSFFTCDIDNIMVCTVAVYAFFFVYHMIFVKCLCDVGIVRPSFATFSVVFKSSLRFMSIGVLVSVVFPFNRYLLMILSGSTRVYGIFDIALKIVMMANSLLSLFATPMLSLFSNYGCSRLGEIKGILWRSLPWLFSAYILGNLMFLVFGQHILNFFVREDIALLFRATLILLAGVCLTGVTEPYYRALLGLGALRSLFIIKLGMCFANIFLVFMFRNINPLMCISLAIGISFGVSSLLIPATFKLKYR